MTIIRKSTLEKFKAARKAKFNPIDLRDQTESDGLKEIKDIPERIKRTSSKRNACKTKKRNTGGNRYRPKISQEHTNVDMTEFVNSLDNLLAKNLFT